MILRFKLYCVAAAASAALQSSLVVDAFAVGVEVERQGGSTLRPGGDWGPAFADALTAL